MQVEQICSVRNALDTNSRTTKHHRNREIKQLRMRTHTKSSPVHTPHFAYIVCAHFIHSLLGHLVLIENHDDTGERIHMYRVPERKRTHTHFSFDQPNRSNKPYRSHRNRSGAGFIIQHSLYCT